MSDGTYAAGGGEPQEHPNDTSSTLDTAKGAAGSVKDASMEAAKDVTGTVKDGAGSVAREAKSQVTDLWHQTRREFGDQASVQQERIASGLSALGDELGQMARTSDGGGMAADLVQRASDRVAGVASWLGRRDPAGVLDDVKAFARRRPAVFIGSALVAGIVAGRLTRALVADARESDTDSPSGATGASRAAAAPYATGTTAGIGTAPGDAVPSNAAGNVPPTADANAVAGVTTIGGASADGDAPLFDESAARYAATGEGDSDERRDTF